MDKHFPAFKPFLDQSSQDLLVECIEYSAISGNYGQHLNYLESYYQNTHQNYNPVSCSSGTSALHLACLGLNMTSSHTVVVPATTNMATFFAPMYTGAKVISCDVDQKSGLICTHALETICKNEDVDFVIIVHLYGHVCDCKKLRDLSIKYKFKVIEDCAEAHFAEVEPKVFAGSYFDAGCFSFYANKIIAGGEGGLVIFRESDCAERAKNLKNLSFGGSKDISKFYHHRIGFNYRLSNLSAALIVDCLNKKDFILEKRSEVCDEYNRQFINKEYIEILPSTLDSYRVNWVYCIKLTDHAMANFSNKIEFLSKLSQVGIEARDYFYPADHQNFFKDYCKEKKYSNSPTSQSLMFYKNSIYLPTYLDLNKSDITEIVNRLEETLNV